MKKRIKMITLTSPRGLDGWLKILSYSDSPNNLIKYNPYYKSEIPKKNEENIIIKNIKDFSGKLCIKIDSCNSRDDAEKLKGIDLYIDKENLPKINDDEIYFNDLIGYKVISDDNGFNGNVIGIESYGASPIILIKCNNSGKDFSSPWIESSIEKIDDMEKTIVIKKSFII